MWLKWMGGALLLTAAVLDGILHTKRLHQTQRRVRAWLEVLRTVHTQISCFATPLPDILRSIPSHLRQELATDALAVGYDLGALCRAAAEDVPSEIGARLRELSDGVGRVWRQEQLERLGQEIRALEQEDERLRAAMHPSIRLRATLSVCGAVAVMILIW